MAVHRPSRSYGGLGGKGVDAIAARRLARARLCLCGVAERPPSRGVGAVAVAVLAARLARAKAVGGDARSEVARDCEADAQGEEASRWPAAAGGRVAHRRLRRQHEVPADEHAAVGARALCGTQVRSLRRDAAGARDGDKGARAQLAAHGGLVEPCVEAHSHVLAARASGARIAAVRADVRLVPRRDRVVDPQHHVVRVDATAVAAEQEVARAAHHRNRARGLAAGGVEAREQLV